MTTEDAVATYFMMEDEGDECPGSTFRVLYFLLVSFFCLFDDSKNGLVDRIGFWFFFVFVFSVVLAPNDRINGIADTITTSPRCSMIIVHMVLRTAVDEIGHPFANGD